MGKLSGRSKRVRRQTRLWSSIAIVVLGVAAISVARWAAVGPPPEAAAHDGPFNVVLISIDTLRADRLGCYGDSSARTPEIDRLAAQGVLFTQATSSCPLTLPSHATMLTGTYPFVHGARDNGFVVDPRHELLSERLEAAGYSTAAVVSAFVLNREFGLDRGFAVYDDVEHDDEAMRAQRRGDRTTDRAVELLRASLEEPFFLFVHYFDPHHPYDPPEPFASELPDGYAGEIAFVDSQVGRLLAEIRRLGADSRTLVVLTSDHGEGLGEHDEDTHGVYLYDATLHVPLIVFAPGLLPPGLRVDAQVRLVDIAPTVLDLLGEAPLHAAQGESMLPLVTGRARDDRLAYAESLQGMYNFGYSPLYALRARGWKLIHAPRPQLYHVATDPRELADLAAEQEARADAMREALRALVESQPAEGSPLPHADEAGPRLGEEAMRRLQSLGYLGAGAAGSATRSPADLFELSSIDPHDHTAEVRAVSQVMSHMNRGRFAEAEVELRQVLGRASNPESMSWALKNLGFVLSRFGRHEEAIEYYQKAVAARPQDGATLTNLATSLAEVGRMPEAFEVFEAAVDAPPVMARTHLNYGIALAFQGRHEEAAEQLRLAVGVEPRNAEAALALARVLVAAGSPLEARQTLWAAFDRRPEDAALRIGAAELLLASGRPEDALAAIEPLPFHETDVRLARVRAGAWAALGDSKKSEGVLRAALERNPTAPALRRSLIALLVRGGRLGEAVSFLRAGLSEGIDPMHSARTLSWLLATAPDAAVRDGAEALRLAAQLHAESSGEDPAVLDILAAALAEVGRFEEAMAVTEAALVKVRATGASELVASLEARRELYQQGLPYRLPTRRSDSIALDDESPRPSTEPDHGGGSALRQ